jgi:hypothetical protein
VKSWTFTARPDQALDALGEALRCELSPHAYGELERTVGEAVSGLPPDVREWTVSLTRYGPTLHVVPLSERLQNRHDVVVKQTPSPFVDIRHG